MSLGIKCLWDELSVCSGARRQEPPSEASSLLVMHCFHSPDGSDIKVNWYQTATNVQLQENDWGKSTKQTILI